MHKLVTFFVSFGWKKKGTSVSFTCVIMPPLGTINSLWKHFLRNRLANDTTQTYIIDWCSSYYHLHINIYDKRLASKLIWHLWQESFQGTRLISDTTQRYPTLPAISTSVPIKLIFIIMLSTYWHLWQKCLSTYWYLWKNVV